MSPKVSATPPRVETDSWVSATSNPLLLALQQLQPQIWPPPSAQPNLALAMLKGPITLAWQRNPECPEPGAKLEPARSNALTRLIQGDNLTVLDVLGRELGGRVALAYLDPPFLTGKAHSRVSRTRDLASGLMVRAQTHAFDDRWQGLNHYLDALAPRLQRVFALLAAGGSMVIHVDSKTSHYVKVLCDELFGLDHFASEIVWRYRRWPSKTRNFQRVHDVLLRYTKSAGAAATFNQLYEPLAASTQKTWGSGKQRAVVDGEGRRRRSSTTPAPSPGVPLGDVWDIGIVAPVAHERTGYPTQKPEALLERLILSLSAPGDWVLDPYAGSGTTLAVAARCGRKSVGIDQSDVALSVIKERLAAAKVAVGEQSLRLPARHRVAS